MDSEQLTPENAICILLTRGEDPDGNAIFAYVALRANHVDDYIDAQQNGVFGPADALVGATLSTTSAR